MKETSPVSAAPLEKKQEETVEVSGEEQKSPKSVWREEQIAEEPPLEDGFERCGGTEVPFEESSGITTATVCEEEDDWELEDDIDLDDESLFDEPAITVKPIRTLPTSPSKRDLSAGVNSHGEYSPTAQPIPRKSSAAASAGNPHDHSFRVASETVTVSRVDEVKEKLLTVADGNAEIYQYIAKECVFDEINGHVRARISPFWKAAALMRFLQMNNMANLVEVESKV